MKAENQKVISNKDLDSEAVKVASQYRLCEAELLKLISKVEERKFYYALGYNSLFSYVHERLGLSIAVTYNLNAVVKKSKDVPELQKKILAGRLSVSTARKLVSVITKENQKTWLDKAEAESSRVLEREISLATPKVAIQTSVIATACEAVQLCMWPSEAQPMDLGKIRRGLSIEEESPPELHKILRLRLWMTYLSSRIRESKMQGQPGTGGNS